ncbi:MAG: Tat pathway signal protein [Vicinamibacteraceae bacterium]
MDRRSFLQNLAAAAAAVKMSAPMTAASQATAGHTTGGPASVDVEGHTLVCELEQGGQGWTVYEDLRSREGAITFLSSTGAARMMPKSAEATFAEEGAQHLGLSMDDVGLSGRDLLADALLANGDDPDPAHVRRAAPPQGSAPQRERGRGKWMTFVGTKEAHDVTPVYAAGSTRTWLPSQHFPELRPAPGDEQQPQEKRYAGLIGGWMPAARTVIELSANAYIEHIVFGDVQATDKYIVQTWHRSAKVENGKITKVVYGYTYPAYPPARQPPAAEKFYAALLTFADYWDGLLADIAPASLPDQSWMDMSKHCFAKELMIRPGGVYPKYGAVDRDYFGAEYDGFQDVFTSALYTSLEWGRFETARLFLEDYFTSFVEANGMINMRGPETAQFGLTLSLLARYYNYTGDGGPLLTLGPKIEATAKVLTDLHDVSLALPRDDQKHGLIQGWSESDACLHPWPEVWWQPYYANSAFAARGLKDLAATWQALGGARGDSDMGALARDWRRRSQQLTDTVVSSMRKNYRREIDPPYMPPLPGAMLPFREAMAEERPSPQQWPHRLYAELLQPDVLPHDLANLTIDSFRSHGGTTLGVVANVGRARPGARSILGFISYGYAQMLLRLHRIEEYLLFLYSHRYHDHTRGSWTAGEVSGITGGTAAFCIPAQQTIPLMVRWMLVLEDSDEERLYFGRALPRAWVASGEPIQIEQAPTRWGRVRFNVASETASGTVSANVELAKPGAPKEIQVTLRTPRDAQLRSVTVNGRRVTLDVSHRDTVVIQTGRERRFEIVGRRT